MFWCVLVFHAVTLGHCGCLLHVTNMVESAKLAPGFQHINSENVTSSTFPQAVFMTACLDIHCLLGITSFFLTSELAVSIHVLQHM